MTTVVLTFIALLAAQSGELSGTVGDDYGGAPLPTVTVTVDGPTLAKPLTTTTDERGSYMFTGVPPGRYTVSFSVTCFRTVRRRNVVLAASKKVVVNAALKVNTGDGRCEVFGSTRLRQHNLRPNPSFAMLPIIAAALEQDFTNWRITRFVVRIEEYPAVEVAGMVDTIAPNRFVLTYGRATAELTPDASQFSALLDGAIAYCHLEPGTSDAVMACHPGDSRLADPTPGSPAPYSACRSTHHRMLFTRR